MVKDLFTHQEYQDSKPQGASQSTDNGEVTTHTVLGTLVNWDQADTQTA